MQDGSVVLWTIAIGVGANFVMLLGFGLSMISLAREQGRWVGTTDQKLSNMDEKIQTNVQRLNAHSEQIGAIKLQLAGRAGNGPRSS